MSTTTNAYGLFLTAPTGATNNYSGVFTGGNFGWARPPRAGLCMWWVKCVTGIQNYAGEEGGKGPNGEEYDEWEEVAIKDIKPGDEILTLDEKTGKLIPSRVRQLADMGVKQIWKLTTASGKSIRTTSEHPYFVRESRYLTGSFEVDQSGRVDQSGNTFIAVASRFQRGGTFDP